MRKMQPEGYYVHTSGDEQVSKYNSQTAEVILI
jgi:hypothetical protein